MISNGSEFLMCVGYVYKYPEVIRLSDTTSKGVTTAVKPIFARHKIPDIVISDNGPQYSSEEFRRFAELKFVRT